MLDHKCELMNGEIAINSPVELIRKMSRSHQMIICNSTLSWWAAYCSLENTVVICPVYSVWEHRMKAMDSWHQLADSHNLDPYTQHGYHPFKRKFKNINLLSIAVNFCSFPLEKIIEKVLRIFAKQYMLLMNALKLRRRQNIFKVISGIKAML